MPDVLKFQPLIKRIRWGGQRLKTVLGKAIGDATDAAESWEIADHGVDQTVVRNGAWAGRTIASLVRDEREALFGAEAAARLAQADAEIAAWDARVRAYVQARDAIRADGRLDAAARDRAIATLQARSFDAAELRRIASLEAIGQLQTP